MDSKVVWKKRQLFWAWKNSKNPHRFYIGQHAKYPQFDRIQQFFVQIKSHLLSSSLSKQSIVLMIDFASAELTYTIDMFRFERYFHFDDLLHEFMSFCEKKRFFSHHFVPF